MDHWIDTHAHIYLEQFDQDLPQLMQRCEQQNVSHIGMPNIDHTSIDRMMEVEARFNNCFAMMGLHPCSVKKDFHRELYRVEDWLSKRKFVAIGEIGTDLYWDKTYWEEQKEAFTIQVQWAKKFEIPIVIHCRESLDETIELVEGLHDGKLSGVFHCFTGSVEQANRIIKLGFLIGIGGVATYKNSGSDKTLSDIGLDHVVLETDSPYLTPVPHRGKRNEPSYIPLIGQKLADIKKVDVLEIQHCTTRNAHRLFKQF